MNRRTIRLLTDGLIALALVVIVRLLNVEMITLDAGYGLALGLVPLVWLGIRHSAATAIVFAAIAGGVNAVFLSSPPTMTDRLSIELSPLLVTGLAGLFAKYSQKTLNNRRYSSTYLNISTAAILVSLTYFLVKFVGLPLIVQGVDSLSLGEIRIWIAIGLSSIAIAGVLIILARINPSTIIPKRSRYLSRKETSRLLND